MLTCTYCNVSFSSRGNLQNHQNTALSCLKLRNETPSSIYACQYCQKNFTTNHSVDRHYKTCIKKYEKMIHERDNKIKRLTSFIDEIKLKFRISDEEL
jgi:uncharacterized Zn-finger protein